MLLEKTRESLGQEGESNQSILKEINTVESLEGLMLKLKLQYFGPLMRRADSLWNTVMLGKNESKKGGTEDKMVGWHHQLNGHEFEQTPGYSRGQGTLKHCHPWGHKDVDTIWQWNNNNKYRYGCINVSFQLKLLPTFLYHSSGSNQTETITNNKKDYGNHLRSRVQLLVTHGL